ncbi:MAG: hypothetical protein QF685_11895 [Verrucomicrobiota bacterium]|jgi:hypothetical protein|nr:hypothetical protein [Verrucomicrobiota bacterium]
MKKLMPKLSIIIFAFGLVSFIGCGEVKDDPNIAKKESKEGKNEEEGENEDGRNVTGDTIKVKLRSEEDDGEFDDE